VNAGTAGRASALEVADLAAALNIDVDRLVAVDRPQVLAASSMQRKLRFDAALIRRGVLGSLDAGRRRLLVHNLVANLAPGGGVVVDDVVDLEFDGTACGLERVGDVNGRPLWRRVARRSVHDLVADARERIGRVSPAQLTELLARGETVVLDTRTPTDRVRDGIVAGSIHAPRTVLEWLVDPASGYSLAAIDSMETPIVVICNEGYSSSLAAATLVDLGFTNVADLIGGVVAWRNAGLPLVPATHHHQEEHS
jgi:rhodanese-related sulfurtransferase